MIRKGSLNSIIEPTGVPIDNSFSTKRMDLYSPIKIGRQAKEFPSSSNGIFDSKVLSRQHAQMYFADGKVWIVDMKSSNGTFLNGTRLRYSLYMLNRSLEGEKSEPVVVNDGDELTFGVDFDEKTRKVLCSVFLEFGELSGFLSAPASNRRKTSPDLGTTPTNLKARVEQEIMSSKRVTLELEHLKGVVKLAKPRIDELTKQLADSEAIIEKWKEKFDQLEPFLRDHSIVLDNNQKLLQVTENEKKTYEERISELEENLYISESKVAECTASVTSLEQEKEKVEDMLAFLPGDIFDKLTTLIDQKDIFKMEKSRLDILLIEANERASNLHNENLELKKGKESAAKEIDSLTVKLEESDSSQQEMMIVNDTSLSEFKKVIVDLQHQLTESQRTNTELESELEFANSRALDSGDNSATSMDSLQSEVDFTEFATLISAKADLMEKMDAMTTQHAETLLEFEQEKRVLQHENRRLSNITVPAMTELVPQNRVIELETELKTLRGALKELREEKLNSFKDNGEEMSNPWGSC